MNSHNEIVLDVSRERRKNTVTKRLAINVGFKCNMRCRFCYYLRHIQSGNTRDLTTEEVKRRLRVGRSWGKTAVDLTGGEPTIRRDLPELICYAKEIGYNDVCVITNGWNVGSKEGYLKLLIDAGLSSILMSLHGAESETHEYFTCRTGSYTNLLHAADKASRFPTLRLRFNYVVCQKNFDEVEAAADLMAAFSPNAINYILFQPTRDASHAEESIKFTNYEQVTKPIKRVIDKHTKSIPHINVRDIPYCLLKGYERYVKPLYQLQYEKEEWDYCLDVLFKRRRLYYVASLAYGALLSLDNPYFWNCDPDNRKHVVLQRARIFTMRRKSPQCAKCAIRHICDGLVKDYIKQYGGGELIPYIGQRITNPTYFMPRNEIE